MKIAEILYSDGMVQPAVGSPIRVVILVVPHYHVLTPRCLVMLDGGHSPGMLRWESGLDS